MNDSAQFSRSVWQSQAVEAPRLSVEYVRHQAEKLNSDLRRETWLGYGALALSALAVMYVWWKANTHPPALAISLRVAAVFLILGAAYVLMQVLKRGRMIEAHMSGVVQGIEVYRLELQRRRDLYWSSLRWSVWPVLPGALLVFGGGLLYDTRPNKLLRYTLVAAFAVTWTLVALWYYKRKGDGFDRELQALDSMAPRDS